MAGEAIQATMSSTPLEETTLSASGYFRWLKAMPPKRPLAPDLLQERKGEQPESMGTITPQTAPAHGMLVSNTDSNLLGGGRRLVQRAPHWAGHCDQGSQRARGNKHHSPTNPAELRYAVPFSTANNENVACQAGAS